MLNRPVIDSGNGDGKIIIVCAAGAFLSILMFLVGLGV